MAAPEGRAVPLGGERMIDYLIRGPRAADQSYIARTWVTSVLNNHRVHSQDAARTLNGLVDRLLDDPATKIHVAHAAKEPDAIIGWCASAGKDPRRVLLYVYVRHEYRTVRIGRALWNAGSQLQDFPETDPPSCYLFDGPSMRWLRDKFPNVTKMEPRDYLQ